MMNMEIEELENELGQTVPSVPDWKRRHPLAEIDENGKPLPYIKANGTLVIPFDSDERFHYWKGGQPLAVTREEAKTRTNLPESRSHAVTAATPTTSLKSMPFSREYMG